MSLTYSHDPSQRLMYKGLMAREGLSSSLTSPSLFLNSSLTVLYYGIICLTYNYHVITHIIYH